jgi:hypothetical protein
MFRVKLVVAVLGGVLAFIGGREWLVSRGTTAEPITVDLAAVEAGEVPENSHWQLGEHVAIYNGGIYQYSKSKYDTGEPGVDTKMDYYYYPVLSAGHPFIVRLGELTNTYGSVEAIPATEIPALTDFAVLIKTKQFATIGAIPSEWEIVDGVQGLVMNQVSSLSSDEEKLLREGFPGLSTDKLLLLEADRRPASALKSGGMVFGGVAVALAGVGWIIAGRRQA